MNYIALITRFLTSVGAINWGLVGALNFNLVEFLTGTNTSLTKMIYSLVGLCGLYSLYIVAGTIFAAKAD